MNTTPLTGSVQRFTDFNALMSVEYDQLASTGLKTDYWVVTQAFRFYLDDIADEKWVEVPAGYLSDGASVPRVFWDLIPPWGAYGQAAVVHDWLCEHLTIEVKGVITAITRADADRALKQGMIALNVPRWKRNVIYIAVRTYAKLFRVTKPDTSLANAKATYEADWVASQDAAADAAAPAAPVAAT
jgi:hypothetical protein